MIVRGCKLAERRGFEPLERVETVRTPSKRVLSTAQPSLQYQTVIRN
jgi:hypothetical protein